MAIVEVEFQELGAIGTIDNRPEGGVHVGYDQRVEILGSKGKIASENRYPERGCSEQRREKSYTADRPLEFFMDRYTGELCAGVAKCLCEAVLEGKPTPVTGADGRAPVVMALAAKQIV